MNVVSNERVSTQVSNECGLKQTSRKPTGLEWSGPSCLHTAFVISKFLTWKQ